MPPDSFQIRRFQNWDELTEHKDAWNQLVLSAPYAESIPSFFQTFEWNQAWWKTFGHDFELLVLGAFQDCVLVGIAPLMIQKKRFPLPTRLIRFIGSSNFSSDYCSFIYPHSRPEVMVRFTDWLKMNHNLWDELFLMSMLDESPEISILKKELASGLYCTKPQYVFDAPTRLLNSPEENHELVNRKSLKRHFNGFKNMGELTYRHLHSADEIHDRLDDFFQQHIGRRSNSEDLSLFLDERQKSFYRNLVSELIPTGWLRFFTVDLNRKSVAYHFGFEFRQKFYWYKPSFDVQYLKKSPGEVLLKTLFEDAISRNLREFDFTIGNEGFKYRFANHVRKVYLIRIFNSFPHYLIYLILKLGRSFRNSFRALVKKILVINTLPIYCLLKSFTR